MDSDVKPPRRPVKPLQAALDRRNAAAVGSTEKPAEPVQPDSQAEDTVTEMMGPVAMDELPGDKPSNSAHPKPLRKGSWRQWFEFHWPPGRKEWITAAVVLILVVGGVGFALTRPQSKPTVTKPVIAKAKVAPKPTTVASTLSGLQVAPTLNQLPVTGVMIENSTDARPQAGLGQAMVVFEAVAEGGVTRFLALYQDTSPANVGPIRSARPYYIQWLIGFDAAYAHVGGSPDALADIKGWGVHDLDEFANGGAYHRVSSREAPHNVYTSIATLNQLETTKGYLHSTFTGFPRKKEAPAKTLTAGTIDLTMSGPVYNVHYDYAYATNSYNRSEGGAPQTDANTGAQISPKVVVAMVVPETQGALDATGAYYSNYNVIGSGPVDIFQDGTATTGTWTKATNNNQISFTDASGKAINLDPGQTWLTAVTAANKINYAP